MMQITLDSLDATISCPVNLAAPRARMVVANWKMFGNLALCRESLPRLAAAAFESVELVVCPPAPYLGEVGRLASRSGVHYGAQDVAEVTHGARTGEWSADMLAELGCRYAIVGHSERRDRHRECNQTVAVKAAMCIAAGVIPIVCVGETMSDRESGQTEAVLAEQLSAILQLMRKNAMFVLAYEPVWAIGTGLAATPEMAQDVHAFLRRQLALFSPVWAESVTILYGGSVKADNAASLFAMPDIDGGLVGGASLNVNDLLSIYKAANI
ncbi:triose-phosphate isomerase [Iodobacter sp. LRB]|uniref:triose-phosphate isomerase n=2 Tax=Iodobacter TaxID=32014 RepID=UPI001C557908|nr:triose-phosphate isomerase [Iodobacter sp. BJB302]